MSKYDMEASPMKATIEVVDDVWHHIWWWKIRVNGRIPLRIDSTDSIFYTRKADAYRGARRVMRRLGLTEDKQ